MAYIDAFPIEQIEEIHLAGFAPDRDDDGAPLLIDSHGCEVVEWSGPCSSERSRAPAHRDAHRNVKVGPRIAAGWPLQPAGNASQKQVALFDRQLEGSAHDGGQLVVGDQDDLQPLAV